MDNKLRDIFTGRYRTLAIASTVLLSLLIVLLLTKVGTGIYSVINERNAKKSPIVSITATNDKTYRQEDKIKASDFTVFCVHRNKAKTELSPDEIKLSIDKPDPTGNHTLVTISYKNKKCQVNVKNERKKISEVECGKHMAEDVKAVLYSNGELCFEGNGDILQYYEGKAPWFALEDGSISVKAVTFEEGVKPKNLDYFFEKFSDLKYIKNIPDSVESIYKMCSGCESLEEGPDLSKCNKLLNMNQAFEGCINMIKPSKFPKNVTSAVACYKNCKNLTDVGNISSCEYLKITEQMYSGCEKILTADFPLNVELAAEMYADCINLEEVHYLPESLLYIDSIFKNDISLKNVPNIPSNICSVASAFLGCRKLEGELKIDGIPNNYSSFLSGACEGNILNLTGTSPMLDVLANTSESRNITVNHIKPDPTKKTFDLQEYQKDVENK